MFLYQNRVINIYSPVTIDGIMYPNLTDPELRSKVGVTEIPDPIRKSDKFYYNQELREDPYLVVTPRPVDQVKPMLWNEVKLKRDQLIETAGCKVQDKWYHSDIKSKSQQQALFSAGNLLPSNLQWKTMDGSFVTLTQSLVQEIFFAQLAKEQAIFAKAEEYKEALYALSTIEELEAFTWADGWPENYSGN